MPAEVLWIGACHGGGGDHIYIYIYIYVMSRVLPNISHVSGFGFRVLGVSGFGAFWDLQEVHAGA